MDNAITVNMSQSIEDLAEQTPGSVDIVIEAIFYEISKRLAESVSASDYKSERRRA